jgi:hypothetical protein
MRGLSLISVPISIETRNKSTAVIEHPAPSYKVRRVIRHEIEKKDFQEQQEKTPADIFSRGLF